MLLFLEMAKQLSQLFSAFIVRENMCVVQAEDWPASLATSILALVVVETSVGRDAKTPLLYTKEMTS